jgi:hypothetical protein
VSTKNKVQTIPATIQPKNPMATTAKTEKSAKTIRKIQSTLIELKKK